MLNPMSNDEQIWQAKGRLQMALREAQLLLLALDAYSSQKARNTSPVQPGVTVPADYILHTRQEVQAGESSEKAWSWHSRRPSSRSYARASNRTYGLDARTYLSSSCCSVAWKMLGALSTHAEVSESNEGTTISFWRPLHVRQPSDLGTG